MSKSLKKLNRNEKAVELTQCTADQDKSCAINSHTDFSKQLKCMHFASQKSHWHSAGVI